MTNTGNLGTIEATNPVLTVAPLKEDTEMLRATEKITALYCRLSQEDANEGDSNSIAHQIEILKKYAKDHNITRYKVYKDDGFSGKNFNRPGFQEMLSDIENGLVSTVIVKDISRFGRNYIEVGMYTESAFRSLTCGLSPSMTAWTASVRTTTLPRYETPSTNGMSKTRARRSALCSGQRA